MVSKNKNTLFVRRWDSKNGKPRDAKRWSSRWIFVFHPQTNDGLFYSDDYEQTH